MALTPPEAGGPGSQLALPEWQVPWGLLAHGGGGLGVVQEEPGWPTHFS